MRDTPFQQLVWRLNPHAEVLRSWALAGGVSAQVMALEVRIPGGSVERWVLRQHGEADVRGKPSVADDEFHLLRLLTSAGLPVPRPLYADSSGVLFPAPVLVTGYVEGQTVLTPANPTDCAVQMADFLLRLHAVRWVGELPFLRPLPDLSERPAVLDETLDEGTIRDALEPVWPPTPRNAPTLLHGDFWPGNVLWREGRLAAVIDWEDAALGDPLADLANARLETLFFYGPDAMDELTGRYRAGSGLDFAPLPLWDLRAALRPAGRLAGWGLEAEVEETLRARHGWFVRQALNGLLAP
ncbi:phosphotransferase family protein [Deinococcus apachensis]|uniref:phosphotransferase family protein n=1 Tax=Deinococcus apachensis TaxID=309886 RepID=UPI00035C8B2A|nr:phosphotransferase [Deinococcus apachensis]